MDWSSGSTPFTYPCFVVWTTKADCTRKGRKIVNIRFNKVILPDAYSMLSQANILANLREATHILTVNCLAFFYQWRVKPDQEHQLTVSLHREQKVFNVAVMGYKNLPAYAQWQINKILQPHQRYARAYVNNIVVFSKLLEEHLRHLQNVFQELTTIQIILLPKKSFLTYSSVHFFGQRVDACSMATAEA